VDSLPPIEEADFRPKDPENFRYVTVVPPTVEPLSSWPTCWKLKHDMAVEPTTRKDDLKVEKLSLLILTLCVVVLVYVLIFRPFW